ncbi:ABC transporter ATP-binding protein [Saccharicrinis fermentans]|uniref:Lipopolysaccharide export system ATP-binding protein LptB n=1 Tax=Saccharicrinis fermentans DSM 9555 = JCM 21142 TaxID=869213 RepID=W7Y300_9BACT|nr:ABC transporter ATP-binding protein [Saccharicrinis fermentans]GAF05205.1 lipopolysaccharide export system ATP-binding protein LptB [Saccharicrinis fermentans DSM 9555 = JCM 21142]
MNNALVRVENLSHRYSIQWAVKDVSFEIPQNGIYGLLGSNGAGKSTTMNIMSGVLRQSQGNIYIKGIDMSRDPISAKKLIGFLPQKPPLYLDTTVEEYLTNCAQLRKIGSKDLKTAVEEVMDICSITHFRKRLIKNLSGGYQQRVGIAQAIIHKPALIVLDEPTNGLDPNQIIGIRGLIKEIAKECAVLLSTHMLTEVQAICDYILMIESGKLVFSGKTEEFDNYLAPNSIKVRLLEMPSVDVLMKIDGVESVEELGGPDYRFRFDNLNGAAERIVKESVKQDWRLEEINLEKNSLNDVFSALSK